MKQPRISFIKRETKETNIEIKLNIDGCGDYNISTNIPFLDHLLSLFTKHSIFNLNIKAFGDTDVDYHHLVEDVGICLGSAFKKAIADGVGINRYGCAIVPMDEALILVAVDISGRGGLFFDLQLKKKKVGNFDTELVEEFFKSFANNAKITLHIKQISGKNTHHIAEASFKALAVALREAVKLNERIKDIPSTKGKI